ncbi:hypothetical protein ACFLYX_01870 [Chloroflexota bacterium]
MVESITLFAFGGLIRTGQENSTPADDVLLAVAGILCNITIASILLVVSIVLVDSANILAQVLFKWLAFLCFMLILLHFVPAFPLDAGRILRAILWKKLGSIQRATRIASWIGWAIGIIFVVGGILLSVFTKELFTGVFLMAVGLILQNAATQSRRK